jgi:diaminopimelate epimerase
VGGETVEFVEVSMGNPHAVVRHPDPASVVGVLGPVIEADGRFPARTNVEFVREDGPGELTMEVWERGVGRTLACGTGACAVGAAAVHVGGTAGPVLVHLPGGDLVIEVDDDMRVTMTGTAEPVFRGELGEALREALTSGGGAGARGAGPAPDPRVVPA